MNIYRFKTSVLFALYTIYFGSSPCLSEPSPTLDRALATHMKSTWLPKTTDISGALNFLKDDAWSSIKEEPPRFAIETEFGKPLPKVKGPLREGTLRQKLDQLTQDSGFVWLADNGWINLIPADKINDSAWVMNKVIPGEVIHSNAPGTPTIRPWLEENKIECCRVLSGMVPIGPDGLPLRPKKSTDILVLQNPTYRQHLNAFERLSSARSYLVDIKVIQPEVVGQKPKTLIYQSADYEWMQPDSKEKAK